MKLEIGTGRHTLYSRLWREGDPRQPSTTIDTNPATKAIRRLMEAMSFPGPLSVVPIWGSEDQIRRAANDLALVLRRATQTDGVTSQAALSFHPAYALVRRLNEIRESFGNRFRVRGRRAQEWVATARHAHGLLPAMVEVYADLLTTRADKGSRGGPAFGAGMLGLQTLPVSPFALLAAQADMAFRRADGLIRKSDIEARFWRLVEPLAALHLAGVGFVMFAPASRYYGTGQVTVFLLPRAGVKVERFDNRNRRWERESYRLHAEWGEPAAIIPPPLSTKREATLYYFVHGVEIPAQRAAQSPTAWTMQSLMEEPNAEVRRVMLEMLQEKGDPDKALSEGALLADDSEEFGRYFIVPTRPNAITELESWLVEQERQWRQNEQERLRREEQARQAQAAVNNTVVGYEETTGHAVVQTVAVLPPSPAGVMEPRPFDRQEAIRRYGAARSDRLMGLLRVVNSTPEPDGHHKIYLLRVPPDRASAQAAAAWTFDIPADEYRVVAAS